MIFQINTMINLQLKRKGCLVNIKLKSLKNYDKCQL